MVRKRGRRYGTDPAKAKRSKQGGLRLNAPPTRVHNDGRRRPDAPPDRREVRQEIEDARRDGRPGAGCDGTPDAASPRSR
jgi:hypothetical protein